MLYFPYYKGGWGNAGTLPQEPLSSSVCLTGPDDAYRPCQSYATQTHNTFFKIRFGPHKTEHASATSKNILSFKPARYLGRFIQHAVIRPVSLDDGVDAKYVFE